MSTLSTYKALLSQKLATSGTGFFTNEARVAAINEAIGDIYQAYDIPALFKVATLTLTSGVGSRPSDYFRMVKMWDASDATPEYTYLPEDKFDNLSTTASSYWTEDYDTSSGSRKILVRPTSVTSVRIRYVVTPTTLSLDTDDSLLPVEFDDVVAYGATAILANNSNQFDKYKAMKEQYESSLARAIGGYKNRGGVKQGSRLRSRFEKYAITTSRV